MAMSPQERTVFLRTRAATADWDIYEPWTCQSCKKQYPVMNMARDCEDKHERDGWPTPDIYLCD